ncbi:somatostatin receptor type 5-like [Saccoglossus kowalevskii]
MERNSTWNVSTDESIYTPCRITNRVVEDVISIILCCCGIPGNLIVIFVVLRLPSMKSVTNVLLVNLAIADLLCLVPNAVYYLWRILEPSIIGETAGLVVVLLSIVGIYVSLNTLVVISVERYLAVCKTLYHKARFVSRKRNMVIAIISIWTLALILSFPNLNYVISITDMDMHMLSTYFYVLDFLFVCIVMSILYARIILTLKNTKRLGSMRARASATREKRVVTLCLATASISIVCMLPWISTGIIQLMVLYYEIISWPTWMYCLGTISNYFVQANSCINPYIYNMLSSKYRRAFREVFCCIEKAKIRRSSYFEKHNPMTTECTVSESKVNRDYAVNSENIGVDSFELQLSRSVWGNDKSSC